MLILNCNLQKIMIQRKITQKKLSEITGVHHTTLKKLRESTIKQLDVTTLIALCSALNIKISDLIEIIEV